MDYGRLYQLLTRLVHLEILRPEQDNRFVFTQKGIDLYKIISQMDFPVGQVRTIGKKHAIPILKLLGLRNYTWNELNKALHISHSSMKGALDSLLESDLVVKSTEGYDISRSGKTLLSSVLDSSKRPYTPVFEIQTKFSIQVSEKPKVLDMIKDRWARDNVVIQRDYYFVPRTPQGSSHGSESYLRYRHESIVKPSIKTPPHNYLTWIKVNTIIQRGNVWILNRSREEIRVEYPSIIYFIEYLGARMEKKIVKRREIYTHEDIKFHFDVIESPPQPGTMYIEIKSKAWDSSESERKVKTINELYDEISTVLTVKSINRSYFDIL
jgi:adenylate cyclase class IV/predicted transcriptional regulator